MSPGPSRKPRWRLKIRLKPVQLGRYQSCMKASRPIVLATLLVPSLLLAACSQDDAPSEAISKAANTVVKQVDGSQAPKLAQGKYAPQDECRDKPGAAEFRARLAQAVKARDIDRLAALAAPDVMLDYGGGAGVDSLRALHARNGELFWSKLDTLLTLGCAANKEGGITLPWYFVQDFGDVDPMSGMIVTGENVPVYAAPGGGAAPTGAISWDVVELVDGLQPDRPMQKVETAGGEVAYVATDKLRSLIDYRLVASSRDGVWSFTQLIAGD